MDLNAALGQEWLETNGLGGFASSTIVGANTRRYHGLLTAALHPPVERYLLLSKLEETVLTGSGRYELSTNLYSGAVHPNGFEMLTGFRQDPFPVFTWRAGGAEIEKRVFMVHGENTTVIEYRLISGGPCTLAVSPLIAFRDYHATTHVNPDLDPALQMEDGCVSIAPYSGLPRLYLAHNAAEISREAYWFYNFEYPRERERGLDFTEDLFQPCILHFELDERAVVIASTLRREWSDADRLPEAEGKRRAALVQGIADPFEAQLRSASDQFLVRRGDHLHTVIAGYHWFTDWSRDTMIALPGLALATGRFDLARDILLAFSGAVNQGMLPNRFPDGGEPPEYNNVDGTLWLFETIRQFLEATGDFDFVLVHLYPALKDIIDWHLRGTRFGIHCDDDGLLAAGTPDTQLTWMDSRSGGRPVTPRNGKAVEIQALWYNALKVTEDLANRFSDPETALKVSQTSLKTALNGAKLFWNEASGCLFDVLGDASVRPNQVIALSLGHTMFPAERALRILDVVERKLLTPFGLRTLLPDDPAYRGKYEGDTVARELSYHQGSVWPWLIGPWVKACRRFGRDAGPWQESFRDHLNVAGLGAVSELFDGEPPHAPRGCVSQAWSVAELLLCYTREVSTLPAPKL